VRLRQVLVNLVGNAVKFTPRGGVNVRLACVSRGGGRVVLRFEVADTGIGIDPSARERIFEVFTQADESATRRHGGTGLGLAIARHIVGAMGGVIGVESAPGAGSTFRAEIPFEEPAAPLRSLAASDARSAALPEPAAALAGPAVPPPAASDGAPAPARILFVEDQQMLREMFAEILETLGRRIDTAANGREAVAAFAPGRYDLIFMDCQMPEMDGFAATAAIRRLEAGGSRTPIVALTAHALAGDRERCLQAGMDDYLGKPFRIAAVRSILERWLPDSSGRR
jgi:CheY-like chemotaxis protein